MLYPRQPECLAKLKELVKVWMTLRRCVLFTALVRLNLEYCLMVWSPYTKRNIDKLERVQRRATKFILKSDDPYD